MKTVWILARSLSTATKALHRNLKDYSSLDMDFITFRFIATADQVRSQPTQEKFIVVRNWRNRPDAEEVLVAIREREWVYVTLKELFLF